MANIAIVKEVIGKVLAQAKDGSIRELKVGDTIADTDTIITGQGRIVLASNNGETLDLSPNQMVAVDSNVFTTETTPTPADSALAPTTAQTVLDSLNGGSDLLENLDATAAGLGAGGGGGGSSFVQLLRIAEQVNPLSFRYGFNPQDPVEVLTGTGVPAEEPAETPAEPVTVTTTETRTEVSTSVTTEAVVGDKVETGRTTAEQVTEVENDDGTYTVKTTTTTTTVSYDQETNTITTTTTTTDTYERLVDTTTYSNGEVTVSIGDWTLVNSVVTPVVETVTTNNPTTEVLTNVDVVQTPIDPTDPVVTVTYEYDTRVSSETTTQTNVGAEVKVGETSTVKETVELNDDETASIKTTTTTTTVTYNQATDTITTTVTTTETYVREVTTTTYPNGDVDVSNSDWTLSKTDTDTASDTVTTNTPRTDVLTDTDVIETPIDPVVVVTTETRTEEVTDVKTETNVKGEVETGRTSETTVTEVLNDDKTATVKTTTVTTTVSYNQDTDTLTTTTITTNTYSRDVTTTTHGTNEPVVVTSDWVLTNSDSIVSTDTSTVSTPRTDVLTDVDTVTTPVEETGENWFISQGGNNNNEQAYTLEEEEAISFNVQFQDRSGEQLGKIADGESITLNIKVTGDQEALALLDILDVKAAKGFSATWELNDDELEILLTNSSGKDQNLQGNPVDVEFKVGDDGQEGTNTSIGFDINNATLGGVWETNDQVNYLINDMIKKGGGHVTD